MSRRVILGLRDRVQRLHFVPYWLLKSTVSVCAFAAVLSTGELFGSGAGFAPLFNASNNAMSPTVLAAAPFNWTLIGREKVQFFRLYAPPEYWKVTLVNVVLSKSIPSSCCETLFNTPCSTCWPIDGTLGSYTDEPIANPVDCAKVVVWLPKNSDPT